MRLCAAESISSFFSLLLLFDFPSHTKNEGTTRNAMQIEYFEIEMILKVHLDI